MDGMFYKTDKQFNRKIMCTIVNFRDSSNHDLLKIHLTNTLSKVWRQGAFCECQWPIRLAFNISKFRQLCYY